MGISVVLLAVAYFGSALLMLGTDHQERKIIPWSDRATRAIGGIIMLAAVAATKVLVG
jgi:hypothetical protein